MSVFTRSLGRSGIKVSAMGMGCWAIGGPFWKNGQPVGWGNVDDDQSIRSIHLALDLGITLFDTAAVYGCGHSERVLGKALAGRRDQVLIATKFGQVFDEDTRQVKGYDVSPQRIRQDCEASLSRLNTDRIDLYQLHVKDVDPTQAVIVRDTLEELVSKGRIRFYGWSTDDPVRSRVFAKGEHCTAIQQIFNLFEGNTETLAVCEEYELASVIRSPLSMGLLTGKFNIESKIPEDDVRSRRPALQEERKKRLQKLEQIRGLLAQDGRTLAQGALGWLWARSERNLPIPGFKNMQQVMENAGALGHGPLSDEQMKQIAAALAVE